MHEVMGRRVSKLRNGGLQSPNPSLHDRPLRPGRILPRSHQRRQGSEPQRARMHFAPLCMPGVLMPIPRPGMPPNRFYAYGVMRGRLLAAAIELEPPKALLRRRLSGKVERRKDDSTRAW